MGHHQTATHRPGKHSYHQIGLVRGQFGNVPEDAWLDWIAKTGFDGWEEASWELELKRCGDDAGAKAYAEERVGKAKKRGLRDFFARRPSARPGPGRRTQRQDDSVPGGRSGRGLFQVAQGR